MMCECGHPKSVHQGVREAFRKAEEVDAYHGASHLVKVPANEGWCAQLMEGSNISSTYCTCNQYQDDFAFVVKELRNKLAQPVVMDPKTVSLLSVYPSD